jgi:hypothetical protein
VWLQHWRWKAAFFTHSTHPQYQNSSA